MTDIKFKTAFPLSFLCLGAIMEKTYKGENMPEEKENAAYTIRPCRKDDLEAMREICIETSSLSLRNGKDRRFLLLMYCDPYVKLAAEDCFVAVDGSDRPVGYILCAPDTRRFSREFRKHVMPEIKDLGFRYSIQARGASICQLFLVVLAPAHLHIDLTASVRRKGVGTALMKTLKEHLSQKRIDRVQLTCGSKNKAAISFYKRNGFKTVFRGFGACVMLSRTCVKEE